MDWIADRRLVLAEDGSRVLGPDEEQSGRLLAAAGAPVSADDCRRYGLGPGAPAPEMDEASPVAGEGDGATEPPTPDPEPPGGGHELTPIVAPAARRARSRRR